MYQRKLYDVLLEWKAESQGETALLVEGARRVGKTTLVKEFATEEYADFLYIDFAKTDKLVADIFSNYRSDISELLRVLQLYFNKELPERKSVIIFDEVQRFPLARETVKYLVADGRFDYIETGSLISIKKNVQNIVIPSEEDRVRLCPLDFEEYLWAAKRHPLAKEIREARIARTPLPDAIHEQAMQLFSEYMLVGGMPQAVSAFIEDGSFKRCDKAKRRILALYAEDMEKLGDPDSRKALSIFQEIPGQLSLGNKRFRFSNLNKNARYREYESAIRWLEDSHVATICRKCTDPNVGYKLNADDSALKCYMSDTGLLVSHAFPAPTEDFNVYRDVQFGRISLNKGMLVENVVAQQIHAAGEALFFHSWEEPPIEEHASSPRPREVDFLITRGFSDAADKPRVCPIEVKSTKRYKTVSLNDFGTRYKKRLGTEILLHPKQLKVESSREYLPLYMSFCL